MDVATTIFKEFETEDYKVPCVKDNLTGARVLFTKKLEVMNDEFDSYIGALVADMIFKQYLQRKQTRENLECINNDPSSKLARMMIEELKRTEHLVYVDTTLPKEEHESLLDGESKPVDHEKIVERKT